MDSKTDPLEFVSMDKWVELEELFLADRPRGLPAYSALVNQKKLAKLGLDYGFKVYRPVEDISGGMVALNKKAKFNEIIIQCPKDDTTILEKALIKTKVIDWSEPIVVAMTPEHIVACLQRVAEKIGLQFRANTPHNLVLFGKDNPPFENISLPSGITFRPISEEHIDLTDLHWVNRYDSSKWAQELFTKANGGFGLFKDNDLVAWAFINEVGSLTHLFTLKEYRHLGLGRIIVKLICNARLKENAFPFAFCMHTNDSAIKLFQSVGFEKLHAVQWLFFGAAKKEFNHVITS